jgi:hypothetical protein
MLKEGEGRGLMIQEHRGKVGIKQKIGEERERN